MKKVYEADNAAEAHMIADMLEQGGIEAQVKGAHDPLSPASVWVLDGNNYQGAMEILSSIPRDDERRNENNIRYEAGRSGFWGGLTLGISAAVVSFLVLLTIGKIEFVQDRDQWDSDGDGFVDSWYVNQGDNRTILKEDRNYDGKPDAWFYYRKKRLQWSEEDSNFDGEPDVWYKYENGYRKMTVTIDLDFDGRGDEWDFYTNGSIISYAIDNDRDGKKDEWGTYENSALVEKKWSFKNDEVIDKVATYKNGRKTSETYDRDRDGTFDETIHYDEFERVVKVEK